MLLGHIVVDGDKMLVLHLFNGDMVLEYTLHAEGITKLKTEDGLLFVGSGYTITKVTIE